MNQPLSQRDHLEMEIAKSVDSIQRLCKSDDPFKQFYMGLVMGQGAGRPAEGWIPRACSGAGREGQTAAADPCGRDRGARRSHRRAAAADRATNRK